MKFYPLACFLCIFSASLWAESLTLYNDSPFPLTAVVQAADGSTLAQITLQPGEQNQWSTETERTMFELADNNTFSLTPFTVIWKCSTEGYYSVCTQIPPGATVTANSCTGPKYCKPEEKKEEKECCKPCPPDEETQKKEK
jgi:hypothetical protein